MGKVTKLEYKIIRSKRKTLGLQINNDGLIVRAPIWANDREIKFFIDKHQGWIERHLKKAEERKKTIDALEPFTKEEINAFADKAKKIISERAAYYAPKIGVKYGRITIRNQRTRWGSCSSNGNLNFNCLLMLAPPEVIDSVVVHELCHLKEMNHSKKFYSEVLKVFPDYKRCDKWLKEEGKIILQRINK